MELQPAIATLVVTAIAAVLVLSGLCTLQPNEAAILQLFGAYRGTTRVPGLRGTNPFYTRKKISLRARNLNGERLKVNDKRGNPIEIAAVVVWRVDDTAKAYVRRRRLRELREAAERRRRCATSRRRSRTTTTTASAATPASRRCSRAPTSSPRALVRELQARFEQGRRGGRGSAAHAPRLRARKSRR